MVTKLIVFQYLPNNYQKQNSWSEVSSCKKSMGPFHSIGDTATTTSAASHFPRRSSLSYLLRERNAQLFTNKKSLTFIFSGSTQPGFRQAHSSITAWVDFPAFPVSGISSCRSKPISYDRILISDTIVPISVSSVAVVVAAVSVVVSLGQGHGGQKCQYQEDL